MITDDTSRARILTRSVHEESASPGPRQTRYVAVSQERPPQTILGCSVKRVGFAWRNVLDAVAEPPVVFVARSADRAAFAAAFAESANEIKAGEIHERLLASVMSLPGSTNHARCSRPFGLCSSSRLRMAARSMTSPRSHRTPANIRGRAGDTAPARQTRAQPGAPDNGCPEIQSRRSPTHDLPLCSCAGLRSRRSKRLGQSWSCVEITLIAAGHAMLNAGSSWRTPVALLGAYATDAW